jgi:hypothetical protein
MTMDLKFSEKARIVHTNQHGFRSCRVPTPQNPSDRNLHHAIFPKIPSDMDLKPRSLLGRSDLKNVEFLQALRKGSQGL